MVLTKEKLRVRLRHLYEELENIFLFPVRCRSDFCPDSTFSHLDLRLSSIPSGSQESEAKLKVAFPITHIIKPPESLVLTDHHVETLSRIVHSRNNIWPPFGIDFSSMSEAQVFSVVAEKILCLVAENVVLQSKYSNQVEASPQLRYGNNGMGNPLVWHGFSDAFLNMDIPVKAWKISSDDDMDGLGACEEIIHSDTEIEDSGTVCVEAKKDIKVRIQSEPFVSQLVSSTVINSFIETNTKKSSHPIPSILINGHCFMVCFYDCDKDLVLLSSVKSLSTKGGMSRTGLFLLWIISHHSTCILDIKESFGKKHESGIRKSFEKHNLLDVLQKLKSRNIPRFEAVLGVLSKDNPADLLPYEDVVAPPSKKMRTHGKEKTIQSNCKSRQVKCETLLNF